MGSHDHPSDFDGRVALADTAVVLAFLALHAVLLAFVAGPASRPLVLPFAVALLASVALFAVDRVLHRRVRSATELPRTPRAPRGLRWGVWLMGGVTVLGVANVWYAALDPARAVLPSIATFAGSLVVTAIFIVMAAMRRADGP